ncbi:restriction endonuclease subunit S [uncultured Streptococcus sp.]|uniref:restriction endonuclease subunit S n=1 Tax=uncultured Streptococcus sp. TaxID=83427 RepID=UPI0025CEDDE4|nr:restriction endonuclease subunit S [uncultured Streptococcus sp.]
MIKRDIPKIRFNNSKIDWQQVKFKNLLNSEEGIRRGPFGSALKKELFVQNSEYVVYEQQNAIYDHFNTRYRISEEKYHELKKFILLPGDFIMSGAGTIGKISLVPEGIENGVFNQALIRLRVNKNTDKEFFLQWMRSSKMQIKLTKANPASAMVNLVPMSEVKEWDVIVPSLEEQSAIGYLFRTLDDLLTSHKDNLANYQSLKAAMLSKMFPKAGQTVPEIRLDGFEREWKKSKLKDVAHRVQGNDGRMDLPTLTISASGGWMNQIDRFSANIAGKEQKNYTLLKKGELSYNHGNSKLAKYGVVFELQDYEEALVPKVYHSFRVNQLADAKFIEIMFSTKIPDRELGKLVSSGARMDGLLNISFDDFMNIAIIIPTIEEQQAIGAYFSNLDQLITSFQEKITQLETLKKKLLQDMFI